MSGALIDLVAKGAQDAYITGSPEVSFFRQNYKRHTNFSIKPERIDYIGTFGSSSEVSIPIKTKGDLLSYVWIEAPNISNVQTNSDGLFSAGSSDQTEFSLHIGGQEVCRMDSLYVQGVHNVLYKDCSAKASCAVTTSEVSDNAKGSTNAADHFIIPFFFSDDWTKSLPLLALQYHEVEIRIKCRNGFTPANNTAPKVYGSYIYLDTVERNHFINMEHEMLITQVQKQDVDGDQIDVTYFNHPVKSLHMTNKNVDGSNWKSIRTWEGSTLYINGVPLYEDMTSVFHHNVVHEMHTSVLPSSTLDVLPLFSWPFCLTMNKSQPTGTLNFSRIDTAKLSINNKQGTSGTDVIYAVNYNILRIKNGMGGVAFGN